ncbi:MAG TPA: MGMT family protein [Microbacteriaceae bacterium]|nr:MGMT family protein [Microbacteriaceae bacterium]
MPSHSERGPAGHVSPHVCEDEFAEEVLHVVAQIPPGRVMTYGGIAAQLGSRASRRVGKVMAHYGSAVPWWRVVHADGSAPQCHDGTALRHYVRENTPLRGSAERFRIVMREAAWRPPDDA